MEMKTIRVAAGFAGALFALGGTAVTARAGTTVNSLDRTFITTVGHGNTAEIQSSRLALKKSSNKKVRGIAEMLIQQHGQAQQALLQLGPKVHVAVPTTPDPSQKAMYRKLSRLSGAAFDKAYMKGQVGAHYQTLALFKKEMASGNDTLVHSYAQRYITDIQNHTQMIAAVASNLGLTVASANGAVYGTNGKPGFPGKSMSGTGHSSSAAMPPAASPGATKGTGSSGSGM